MKKTESEGSPFFSVIVCTYNRATLIRHALDSLLVQTCGDWECIIIDDDSGDNTREIIGPYLKNNFQYIRHTHRGCALSKNTGMEAAHGRYITFLDSDDEYKPGHLAIRKNMLQKEPGIDLLYSDVTVVGDPFVPDKDHPDRMIAIADCVVGGTFVIKRQALRPADRFRDVYSDDSIFLEKFAAAGREVKKINAPTYIYHRDSPDSMCSQAEAL